MRSAGKQGFVGIKKACAVIIVDPLATQEVIQLKAK
jgi:hypothetical protein